MFAVVTFVYCGSSLAHLPGKLTIWTYSQNHPTLPQDHIRTTTNIQRSLRPGQKHILSHALVRIHQHLLANSLHYFQPLHHHQRWTRSLTQLELSSLRVRRDLEDPEVDLGSVHSDLKDSNYVWLSEAIIPAFCVFAVFGSSRTTIMYYRRSFARLAGLCGFQRKAQVNNTFSTSARRGEPTSSESQISNSGSPVPDKKSDIEAQEEANIHESKIADGGLRPTEFVCGTERN